MRIDTVSTKRSISTTPFQLVYDVDATFTSSNGILVMRYLQELGEELNHLQRKIKQLIEVEEKKRRYINSLKISKKKSRMYLTKRLRKMISNAWA